MTTDTGHPPLRDVVLRRVDTLDDVADFTRWLGERRPVLALDTETTGLNHWRDRIRLVQFGDATTGWTIRWSRWRGLVEEVLRRYEGPLVLHNAAFDLKMLETHGITVPTERVHDTMVMAHALDASQLVGLKSLATRLIDPTAGIAERMLDKAFNDHGWTWATIPYEVPIYSVYAGMDTVLTARLHDVLLPEVRRLVPRAYDLELAFSLLTYKMEMRGVRVDHAYAEEAYASFDRYVADCTRWTLENYGVPAGNNDAVAERLVADGVDLTEKTDTGRWKLGKDELTYAITRFNHPLAQVVLQRRRAQKLASTYLRHFITLRDSNDLLHAHMKSIGARTGRMSITEPPLQTLPRRSENNPLAITVRNCIISRPDHVLMMCDFAQIEMRMLASFAQDPGLIDAFLTGDDFFTEMCRSIFNDPTITKQDPRRQTTKNAAYAKAYGAGVAKFSLTAGITAEEGNAFMAQMDARFPGIRRLQRQVDEVARERAATEGRPYVTSPLTGRRHYADDDKIYALVNYLIQGTAAEVLKRKALELDAAGLGPWMTLLVHDEVILDAPREHARDAHHVLTEVMNDRTMFAVPLEAETELAWRWGEKGQVTLDELDT